MSAFIASISVKYSRSVTGTPADFSSWKKVTNMLAIVARIERQRNPGRCDTFGPRMSLRCIRATVPLVNQPATQPKMQFRFTAAAVAVLMLLAPALWNGYPLLQYDTGGYLARWYEGHLAASRSWCSASISCSRRRPDFWPALAVQSLVTVWVLWLTLRAHALATPLVLMVTIATLTIVTSLPWLVSTLLTDVFAGLSVSFYSLHPAFQTYYRGPLQSKSL